MKYDIRLKWEYGIAYPKPSHIHRSIEFHLAAQGYMMLCWGTSTPRELYDYHSGGYVWTDYYFIKNGDSYYMIHAETATHPGEPSFDGYSPTRRLLREYANEI